MPTMRILVEGEPQLRERARDVDSTREDLTALVADMVDTMREARGIGLAATQLGVMKRVLVYEIEDEGPKVIVNPEIVGACDDIEEDEEGCLSVPDVKIAIARSCRVTVRGCDERGAEIELEAEGLLARVLQHEVDHLDGLLILDRASREERRRAMRQRREAERLRAGLQSDDRSEEERSVVPGDEPAGL